MKRFILTGTPGAGKTVLLRQLERDGFGVVEEAATDVIALEQAQGIAEPWTDPGFIDHVVELQRRRQRRAAALADEIQFHDRSVFCTAALADYLGYPASPALTRELAYLAQEAVFERRVFLVRSLGFVAPTAARRITQDQAVRFEAIHERTYRDHGFEIVSIAAGGVLDRVAEIRRAL
jgi:predicted ATPase